MRVRALSVTFQRVSLEMSILSTSMYLPKYEYLLLISTVAVYDTYRTSRDRSNVLVRYGTSA